MNRGTKEFYEIKADFEKCVKNGDFGCMSSDLTEDNSHRQVFYANGEVNLAFKIFMTGYANARLKYKT